MMIPLRFIRIKYLLVLILILSLFVRVFKISDIPPSLNWDEASIGYDAWALGIDGKDQWGRSFPYVFQSFGEYKFPFHIYTTALFIMMFGLEDHIVRLPSAILGVTNILLLFFLARYLIGSTYIGLLSCLFLAISPWHIQFSRVNWETNFVLFFFFSATLLFLKSTGIVRKWNRYLIPISYVLFGLTIYTYNAAKVFIPIYVLILTVIYFKQLTKQKVLFFLGIFIFTIILCLNLLNPKLSGSFRFKQVDFSESLITATNTYKLTGNRYLSRTELIIGQYLSHFSPEFLFLNGDKNPRHSTQFTGQIYLFDGLFILLGVYLLLKRREKADLVLLMWFFIAPIPASIVKEAPHASRAMFALGSWHIVSAIGLYHLYSRVKARISAKLFFSLIILLIAASFVRYLYLYLNSYPIKYSQQWQYGYKQIFKNYKNEFPKYDQILISDEYGQPYIFALYYLKYNPEEFRTEATYNPESGRGFSMVREFGKFKFGKIETLLKESFGKRIIFATDKEKLLNYRLKESINFLDGSIAFWVYEL